MTTAEKNIIRTAIRDTYGKTIMADHLAEDLIKKLPEWSVDDREHQIMLTCWNWFSGGSTAESVASNIHQRLTGMR